MLALEDSQFRLAVLGMLSVNEWQDATRLSERDPETARRVLLEDGLLVERRRESKHLCCYVDIWMVLSALRRAADQRLH